MRNASVRFGSVRFGSVRFGSVRFGSVRFGLVRFGSDPRNRSELSRRDITCAVPHPLIRGNSRFQRTTVQKLENIFMRIQKEWRNNRTDILTVGIGSARSRRNQTESYDVGLAGPASMHRRMVNGRDVDETGSFELARTNTKTEPR